MLVSCTQSAKTIADIRVKYGIETSVIVYERNGVTTSSSHFYETDQLVFVKNTKSGKTCFKVESVDESTSFDCDGQEN